MDIIKSSESVLKLKRIYFKELNFSREDVEKSNIDVEVEKNQSTDNEYEITLNLSIANSEEKYTVNVSIVGVFEFSENADEVTKNIIIEKNTISILFPYVRSQVTLLTSQPDIKPMIIPPLNINNLIKNIKKHMTQ